jgi:hypothetical protein
VAEPQKIARQRCEITLHKPGASPAAGPRWPPARIASRAACPLLGHRRGEG